jgi:hypothetical protein
LAAPPSYSTKIQTYLSLGGSGGEGLSLVGSTTQSGTEHVGWRDDELSSARRGLSGPAGPGAEGGPALGPIGQPSLASLARRLGFPQPGDWLQRPSPFRIAPEAAARLCGEMWVVVLAVSLSSSKRGANVILHTLGRGGGSASSSRRACEDGRRVATCEARGEQRRGTVEAPTLSTTRISIMARYTEPKNPVLSLRC